MDWSGRKHGTERGKRSENVVNNDKNAGICRINGLRLRLRLDDGCIVNTCA